MTPLDTAIWWTEYVLRHKGAYHMRVAGQDLGFFAYHSLDVIGTLLGGALLVLSIILYVLWKIAKLAGFANSKKKQKTH